MLAALILGLEAALIASQPRSMGVRGGDNKQPPVSSPPWCLGTEAIARQLRGRRNNPTRGCQGCAYCAYSIIITRFVQGHRQPPFLDAGRLQLLDAVLPGRQGFYSIVGLKKRNMKLSLCDGFYYTSNFIAPYSLLMLSLVLIQLLFQSCYSP